VKKCASCTKDLPDAALHCVFCGAKQPPAPAVQQSMAKTAFGYSANQVLDQVKQQGGVPGRPLPPATQTPAYNPPPPPPRPAPLGMAPTAQVPRPMPPAPSAPAYPPAAPPPGNFVPASPANAATMYAPSPQAQQPTLQPPPPSYARPSPAAILPTLVPTQPHTAPPPPPQSPPPIMQIPAAQPPPYHTSPAATRSSQPIEPWRDSLRLMMFLWGVALLAAFAAPLSGSPLRFNWTLIIDGAGTARLPPLLLAAIGLLSVVLAAIPMPAVARGGIAALLGLAGIAVPVALTGLPAWQVLLPMVGTLLLVPSLLVRNEYRDALVPRILVTLGAIGILLPALLPQNGAIPLVSTFKDLIDQPGTAKIPQALSVGLIFIVVMSLLAWLPAPVTGAAKLWAWLLILWAFITHVTLLVVSGHVGDVVASAPNATVIAWVAGEGVVLGSAYLVLVGYGLASVVGKQLE
jgi:hypothetical protein